MVVNIFAPPVPYAIQTQADFTIAVESAAFFLQEKNHPIDLIVGDFDSSDYASIQKTFPDVAIQKHAAVKDETDSMLAVLAALEKNPETIYLYTNAGVRFDHMEANLRLLLQGPVVLLNDHIKAYVLRPGRHVIENSHPYISLFGAPTVHGLTLEGFAYTLEDADLKYGNTVGISNQGSGVITFKEGHLLVIEARD